MNKQFLEKLAQAGLGYCDYTYTDESFKELAICMSKLAQGYEVKYNGMTLLNCVEVYYKNDLIFKMTPELDLSDYKSDEAVISVPQNKECFCIRLTRLEHFMPYLLEDEKYTVKQYEKDVEIIKSLAIDGYIWFVSTNFLMEKIIGHVRTLSTRISHNFKS